MESTFSKSFLRILHNIILFSTCNNCIILKGGESAYCVKTIIIVNFPECQGFCLVQNNIPKEILCVIAYDRMKRKPF